MRVHQTLAGLLGLSLFLGGVQTGIACSCLAPPPPQEALEQSTAVFAGRVVEIRAVNERRLEVLFDIEESWKGVSGQRVLVWTPSNEAACGMNFMWGERYLVYASDSEGLSVLLCSRTAPLANAEADIEALGPGLEPSSNAVEGDVTGDRKVDVSDALQSLWIAVGLQPPTTANEVSGDGLQTLADTGMLLRYAVGLQSRFPISRIDPYCGDWQVSQTFEDTDVSPPIRRFVLEGRCVFPSEGYEVVLSPAIQQSSTTWIFGIDKTVHSPTSAVPPKETEVSMRFEAESKDEYLLMTLLPDQLAVLVPPAF